MSINDQQALLKLILELSSSFLVDSSHGASVHVTENITEKYMEIERGDGRLRRRHAEKVTEQYGAIREPYLKDAGIWRRSFVTHITGCQPCNGKHNVIYDAESCWTGMVKALNFADNQVLRKYGFVHSDLLEPNSVVETPFDYPDAVAW